MRDSQRDKNAGRRLGQLPEAAGDSGRGASGKKRRGVRRPEENIGKLCGILHPATIVCMGSGYLNDIPLDDMIAVNADIYFAEWIDGITQQAFHHDLVRQIADRFICLACQCSGDPAKYCKNYFVADRGPLRPQTQAPTIATIFSALKTTRARAAPTL